MMYQKFVDKIYKSDRKSWNTRTFTYILISHNVSNKTNVISQSFVSVNNEI